MRVARRRTHPRTSGEAMTEPENIFAFKLTLVDTCHVMRYIGNDQDVEVTDYH